MKIGLIGYGKMNREVEARSPYPVVTVTRARVEDFSADLYIDFSHASCVVDNAKRLAEREKKHLIGTTGWDENIEQVRALVEAHRSTALYSPNFSLDVANFFSLVAYAARLFGPPQMGREHHHISKKDAPSGTAKRLSALYGVPFTTKRSEEVCFEHTLTWETLSITHSARDRTAYVQGALNAADWLADKTGWYTHDDWLRSLHTLDHPLSQQPT